jgi:D-lactate dehydrogenase (cytochrome)
VRDPGVVSLLIDLADGTEVLRAEALLERLVERALAMDGTSTGEHAVGQGKVKYLRREHGEAALFSHARHQDGTGPA